MCTIFISYKNNEDYPLIILGNRDESKSRKSLEIKLYNNEFICGMDLEKGGTWGGININSNFVLLTNIRDKKNLKESQKSRGEIPLMILRGELDLINIPEYIQKNKTRFGQFNLIFGNSNSIFHIDNIHCELTQLSNGFHGISNGTIDDMIKKVDNGLKQFKEKTIHKYINTDDLMQIMFDTTQYDSDLHLKTGFSRDEERMLSSLYITDKNYGKVSTYLIIVDKYNKGLFIEKTDNNKKEILFNLNEVDYERI